MSPAGPSNNARLRGLLCFCRTAAARSGEAERPNWDDRRIGEMRIALAPIRLPDGPSYARLI